MCCMNIKILKKNDSNFSFFRVSVWDNFEHGYG